MTITDTTAPARPTASTITDDYLDLLHGQIDGLSALVKRQGDALTRVEAAADQIALDSPWGRSTAERIRAAVKGVPRVAHVAGDPDHCPACRLLPAAQVPDILCPGPKEQQ